MNAALAVGCALVGVSIMMAIVGASQIAWRRAGAVVLGLVFRHRGRR